MVVVVVLGGAGGRGETGGFQDTHLLGFGGGPALGLRLGGRRRGAAVGV